METLALTLLDITAVFTKITGVVDLCLINVNYTNILINYLHDSKTHLDTDAIIFLTVCLIVFVV